MNISLSREKVFFGEVVYAPGGVFGPRKQRDYQLVVIHRGWLDLRLDKETIAIAPGQAILLAPNHREHFLFSRTDETHHSWCSIKPALVPAKMRQLFGSLRNSAPFDSRLAALLKLGRAALSRSPQDKTLEDGFCLGLGLALFSGFALGFQTRGGANSSSDEALARMEDFVSREYAKPLQLAELASAAGVSRQHLLKLFRERKWPTPTDYLYGKRLEAAADLLAHTGLAIGEIAERCGFANPFHFSRKFRNTYGHSPRAWRALAWSR